MVLDYNREIGGAFVSRMACACCGSHPYVLKEASDTICSFCEAYVSSAPANPVYGDAKLASSLSGMSAALYGRKWEAGAALADVIAASGDPHLLFGAAAYYRAFSDYVYNDVDYTLGGFMYPNAEKRSDEASKNKHNAMALISKSKGFLFDALKVISGIHGPDGPTLFVGFMACMKLGRLPQASVFHKALGAAAPEAVRLYADMVYSVGSGSRDSAARIDLCFDAGIANSAYYLSRHLANEKKLDSAIGMAELYGAKTGSPNMGHFTGWLKEVRSASGFGD